MRESRIKAMDKLKDIIYDYTDLILSLLVVLAIVFIIGTNFTFFDQNLSGLVGSSDNGNSSDNQSLTPVDEDDEEDVSDNVREESNEDDGNTEPSEETETVRIQIPQGASASQIGDILQTNELVDSSSEFVESTENLNVSHRLRPGTFDIPRDATLREMIQILIQSSL